MPCGSWRIQAAGEQREQGLQSQTWVAHRADWHSIKGNFKPFLVPFLVDHYNARSWL